MNRRKACPASCVIGGLAIGLVSTAFAHQDDPKAKEVIKPYLGPGYRAAADGGGGIPVGFPSDGVTLLSWLPLGEFPGAGGSANDCWGYVSPSGREYAIIGLECGTGFADITDPAAAFRVGDVVPGACCTWRDIKTYGEYAYIVSECGSEGVQVVDLTQIDSGTIDYVGDFSMIGGASHNVALNPDSGHLYRTGGDGYGLVIYDLDADPTNPPIVGMWDERYVHNAQIVTLTSGPWAGKEIAYCCSGFGGGGTETGMDILDVTDPGNIINLSRYEYPNGVYSHQGWLSADRQLFYLGDELDEGELGITTDTKVIDVSDLENPVEVSTFTNGSGAVGHNMYVRGDTIFQANYSSGLRVFDASSELEPAEFAYFDTVPGGDGPTFNGLWSCYPLYPSGVVIGSDRANGLFVWIVAEPLLELSLATALPDLITPSGQTLQIEITELEPGGLVPDSPTLHYDVGEGFETMALTSLGDDLYEATLPDLACPGNIRFYFSAEETTGLLKTLPSGRAGAAYERTVADDVTVAYQDDMETDPGWAVASIELEGGEWERGVPAGDGDRGDPTEDFDGSGQAWLTENGPGNTDVDGGPTRLTSQSIDLTGVLDPVISYARWFTNDDGDDDRLDVEISNDDGGSWTLVESVPGGSGWQVNTFLVADVIDVTSTMRLRFSATDNPNDSYAYEAAIDALEVISLGCDQGDPADLDGSGSVGFADLLILLAAWGDCPAPPAECPADLDGSGVVSFTDLLSLLASWG